MYSAVPGSVGVGTMAPAEKFHVAGSAKVDSTLFTSDVSSNSPLRLQTVGTTRVYIDDTSGNVGIGTSSPAEKLEVDGTVQMTGFKMPTGASDGHVLTSDSSGVGSWRLAALFPDSVTYADSSGYADVAGYAPPPDSVAYADSAGADGDWTVSGNNMYSAVSGNVGIGTTSPNEKLHVVGNIKMVDGN